MNGRAGGIRINLQFQIRSITELQPAGDIGQTYAAAGLRSGSVAIDHPLAGVLDHDVNAIVMSSRAEPQPALPGARR